MEESSSSGTRSGAQRPKMKEKEPEKSVKKRNKEEEEEEEIFDFTKKSQEEDEDEEDEDASDSEDSVFSGLEDSGSDEDEEEEELSDDEDEEEVDLRVEPRHTQQVETGTVKKTEKEEEEKKKEKTETDEVEGGATEEAKREDEYVHDSSDEEDIRNTVGNVPMEWYRDFPHIGYNLDGKKIYKPIRNKDELDDFLDKMENPDYWRTVPDKQTGSDVVLSDEQVQLVNRLQRGQFGDANFNEYEPQVEFFSRDVMLHPVTNRPADKRSFIPSLIEKEKVSKLVHAIKMGWIKPRRVEDDSRGRYYDLWANEDSSILARHKMHLPAPKIPLPGHQESYNPPPEYLFTDEERAMWEQQDPCDRKLPFVPRKFSSLRQVPAFSRFIHERFERCLDLYLCPRQRKMRVNVNPEDLIPKLPKPKDLQPFPTTQSLVHTHTHTHTHTMCTGSDDGSVRFWEVCSSRCLRTVQVGGAVKSLAWNPNLSVCLLAVALDSVVLVLSPSLADRQVVLSSERLLSAPQEAEPNEGAGPVTWSETEGEELTQGIRLKIQHPKAVQQVTWHAKGDYLASVMPDHSSHMQVLIHQLSRRRSQNPFRKNKGLVQCVSFHPVRPYFFVGTQRSVRIYNLVHVILWFGAARLCFLQVIRHHKKAVRGVAYHRLYPLFASSAPDDGPVRLVQAVYNTTPYTTLIRSHYSITGAVLQHASTTRIYTLTTDHLQNPLLVPVKVLRGHDITADLGVLDVTFHPTQPWVFSSGADATVRLFT
ncbi:ribosome biogenesis protein bop1 [Etheostoma spectabile]|uniref:ribosome biogenesis protein bop1 n=1 Tax=Etheostoma spectabile TaxID=54343 RepID=UPI0013AEC5CB|nr:ribosome biogenesis protein bop1-like [Etheostoma spectabile]